MIAMLSNAKKYLIYWFFGLIFFFFWNLKYLTDHVWYPGEVVNYNAYNILMVFLVIPYISGLIISYCYKKINNEKFVWSLKNLLKIYIFGAIILAIWFLFVFILQPFLPDWWNNYYTMLFFATFPSFIGGLIVYYVVEKWL